MNKNKEYGFTKLIHYASDKFNYYVVMQLVGKSLKDFKDKSRKKRLSLKNTI